MIGPWCLPSMAILPVISRAKNIFSFIDTGELSWYIRVMAYSGYDCNFNDAEVLRYNKGPLLLQTLKMAECRDYPEHDLAEFYQMLAQDKEGAIVDDWNMKSLNLWDDLHERKFYVRRKK